MTITIHVAITAAEAQALADHEAGTCRQSEWSCSHCETADVSDPSRTVEGMTTTTTTQNIDEDSMADERLPKHCPDWCSSGPAGHRKAYFEEGCDLEGACLHISADFAGRADEISNVHTGNVTRHAQGMWGAVLHRPSGGRTVLKLEVTDAYRVNRVALNLTTGEARILAAQLLRLADREDMDELLLSEVTR